MQPFATIICSSVIAWSIITYGFSLEDKGIPVRDDTMTKGTSIYPKKDNASLRDSIVSFGMELLGTPYFAGACSKDGFDCSGFVYFVFKHFKVKIPRTTSQFKNFGKEIPIDSAGKGDILIFLSPTANVIGHVGIVTNPKGNESDFIHASSGIEMKVIISSLKQAGYKRRFVKAIDVLSHSVTL